MSASFIRPSYREALALALPILLLFLPGCAQRAVEAPPTHAVTAPAGDAARPSTPKQAVDESDNALHLDFSPAFFDYDSYVLRKDARDALDRAARLMRERPGMRIVMEGHCDERGTAEYNIALGERRAQSARDYLVAAGVATSRIEVISYGKERPFAAAHDETAWALNRRAHLVAR